MSDAPSDSIPRLYPATERPLWTVSSPLPVPALHDLPHETRGCPACRHIGARAAARCGHYWRITDETP